MNTTCEICGATHGFRWTDTHGVGVCYQCGAPYTIFHYEDDKRVDKPPALALSDVGKALALRYWTENHAMVFPSTYDFFSGRGGATYSGATSADVSAFEDWLEKQPEVQAARPQENASA